MLCEKYRMTSHWRLLPVVRDLRRRKPLCNKIFGMAANGIHTFFCNIVPILLCQMEFGTEPGHLQFGKCLIDGLHMIFFLLRIDRAVLYDIKRQVHQSVMFFIICHRRSRRYFRGVFVPVRF